MEKILLEKIYTNVFKREDQTNAVSSDHKEKKQIKERLHSL